MQHLNRPLPALAPRCPDAPFGLVELVERMLAKHYEDRPGAAEVRDAAAPLHGTATVPAYLVLACEGTAPVERVPAESEPPTARLRAER